MEPNEVLCRLVIEEFGITREKLFERTGKRWTRPRQVAMYLMRDEREMKLREIASFFDRSIAAVDWACHVVKFEMAGDAGFAAQVERVRGLLKAAVAKKG